MVSFTLKFINVPDRADRRFAKYNNEWQPVITTRGDFSPVTFTNVSSQGDLLVLFSGAAYFKDELLFANQTFEDGAVYVCDYATSDVYMESSGNGENGDPSPGISFDWKWLLIPVGVVGVVLLVTKSKKK